ncbi:hypothetical protein [Aneurinibacillus terranovensis]|uniref:hypothetical protein n=1 Tax=Aneurinibacillus terranovensis TaxID=278991 RepID=UPI0003F86085|nr:hypothetical protein [Aneurinibacillus terranovensis]
MAKNAWVKWVMGLTSVASFTGFIGLAGKADAEKKAAADLKAAVVDNTGTNQAATSKQGQHGDVIQSEWQAVAANQAPKGNLDAAGQQKPHETVTDGSTSVSSGSQSASVAQSGSTGSETTTLHHKKKTHHRAARTHAS